MQALEKVISAAESSSAPSLANSPPLVPKASVATCTGKETEYVHMTASKRERERERDREKDRYNYI